MTNKGSWISLLIGGPIGLICIFTCSILGVILAEIIGDGEGLIAIVVVWFLFIPVLVLTIAFIISLWFAGRFAEKALRKNQHLLWVSAKYSLLTNMISWAGFIGGLAFQCYSDSEIVFVSFIPLLIAIVICIVLSTFTVGLLVCFVIKKRLN